MTDRKCLCCICTGDATTFDRVTAQCAEAINKHGVNLIGVFPTSKNEAPPYVYSVGMWHSYGQPEIAIYGVGSAEIMAHALNVIAAHASRGRELLTGVAFDDAMAMPGVDRYVVRLSPIHRSWRASGQFGAGDRFSGTPEVPYLHVLWPDRSGRYPGDRTFDAHFDDRQPQQWLPRADHPPSIWLR